jgi:hypothetical protein
MTPGSNSLVPSDRAPEPTHDHAVRLAPALQRALGGEARLVNRLAHACTTVAFVTTGPEPETATLLLDRRPPQLGGEQDAEVVIELSPEQTARFVQGHLALPAAVLAGQVAAYGDVRKYLGVDPILRELLAGDEREEDDAGGTR